VLMWKEYLSSGDQAERDTRVIIVHNFTIEKDVKS